MTTIHPFAYHPARSLEDAAARLDVHPSDSAAALPRRGITVLLA